MMDQLVSFIVFLDRLNLDSLDQADEFLLWSIMHEISRLWDIINPKAPSEALTRAEQTAERYYESARDRE